MTRSYFAAAALIVWGCLLTQPAAAAGITLIQVPGDGVRPPLEGAVWSPCAAPPGEVKLGSGILPGVQDCPIEGQGLPLVVISHGFGGSFVGHHDTAEALADAGFVVAAINHPGDSGRSPQSEHEDAVAALTDRPADIKRLIDHMLATSPFAAKIDRARVGFFGFSRGGFTGLALIGGDPDFRQALAAACPEDTVIPDCVAARKIALPIQPLTHDPRIKAAVIADPLFGRFFRGLQTVQVPVQLWASELGGDGVIPDDAATAARNLAAKPEFHSVAHSAHFAFLPPCNARMTQNMPRICVDGPGFDRAAFHAQFDAQVVAFMRAHLLSHS